jgi:hypothetical protein
MESDAESVDQKINRGERSADEEGREAATTSE